MSTFQNNPKTELIFEKVFEDILFPLDALDLGLLNKYISRYLDATHKSNFTFPISYLPSDRQVLNYCLRAFLRNLNFDKSFLSSIQNEASIKRAANGKRVFNLLTRSRQAQITLIGSDFVWIENSIVPILYSTFMKQFINLINGHKYLMEVQIETLATELESKGFDRSNVNRISQFPRILPTRHHYAAASLGAWLGGSMNFGYLSFYSDIRQIYHPKLNIKYLTRMGFEESLIQGVSDSGIIGITPELHADVMVAQNEGSIFGDIPINEFNGSNLPAVDVLDYTTIKENDEDFLPGIIIDKYYRASFFARTPKAYGLYGAQNVLRDHYKSFYEDLRPKELIRCKHYCVPIIDVGTFAEMSDYISVIPIRGDGGIFFRGQRKLYTLSRVDIIKEMLFANSCAIEPSLLTAASRYIQQGYLYEDLHFKLRRFLGQNLYSYPHINTPALNDWRSECESPNCKLDYAVMALAQHYGLPTNGLDVTTSLDVALWFATNLFKDLEGFSSYTKLTEDQWPHDPSDWPIILVCQSVTNSISPSLQDCQELSHFGIEAKRPTVQSAKLFHGGHSDHQNRLAETVVCVFRLRPGNYETNVSFDSLFPPPEEDSAYALMLKFAKEYENTYGKYINKFHNGW